MLFVKLIESVIHIKPLYCFAIFDVLIGFLFPFSFAVFHAIYKLSIVGVAIGPLVLSVAARLSLLVLADVNVTVREKIGTVAAAEAGFPLAFVAVSIDPGVNAITFGFIVDPLTNIAIAIDASPHAVAFFLALAPFTIEYLSITPVVSTLAMCLSCRVLTLVLVTIAKELITSYLSLIIGPLSFKNPTSIIHNDTLTMAFPLPIDLATIYRVLILLNVKELTFFPKRLIVKLIRDHVIEFNGLGLVLDHLLLFYFFLYGFQAFDPQRFMHDGVRLL